MDAARWEHDETGRGVADASSAVPAIEDLARLARTKNWVAEDPRHHLGASIRASLAGSGIGWVGDAVADSGAYEVELSHEPGMNRKAVRQAAWTLIGTIAEASTHVEEEHTGGSTFFNVVTGMPEARSTPFATHGHLLTVRFSPRG